MEKTHENWAEPERQDDEEMFGTLDNYEPKKKSQRLSDDEDDSTAASTSGAQSTMRQADLPAHSSSSVMVETENQMDLSVASTSCANESQPQAGCSYTSEPGRKRPHPERQYRQRTASNTSSNDDEPVVVEADVPVAIENDDECSSGSIELMSETTVSLGSPVIESPLTFSNIRTPPSSTPSVTSADWEVPDYYQNPPYNPDLEPHSASDATTSVVDAIMAKPLPRSDLCLVKLVMYNQYLLRGNPYVVPLIRNQRTPDIHYRERISSSAFAVERLGMSHSLQGHFGCVNSIHFNRTGDYLVSGSDDLHLIVWKWATSRAVVKHSTGHHQNVFQTKFIENGQNADGFNIVTSGRDGDVRYYELGPQGTVRSERRLHSHAQRAVNKIALLPFSPFEFMSAGEDGIVNHYDLRTRVVTELVSEQSGRRIVPLYSVAASPIDMEFCVSGMERVVRVHDRRSPSEPIRYLFPRISHHNLRNIYVTSALYNHDGHEILASYSGANAYLFNNREGVPRAETHIHTYCGHKNVQTVKGVNFFGAHSEFVISGSDCGNVFIWDRSNESIVQWMKADRGGVVNCLESHPTFPILATSGLDHDIKIWLPKKPDGRDFTMDELKSCVQHNLTISGLSNPHLSQAERTMQELQRRRRLLRFRDQAAAVLALNNADDTDTEADAPSLNEDRSSEDDDDDIDFYSQ